MGWDQTITFSLIVTQFKIRFRNSDPFPISTINNTFPTVVLCHSQYFVPLAHLLLKSPILVHVFELYRSVYLCYVTCKFFFSAFFCLYRSTNTVKVIKNRLKTLFGSHALTPYQHRTYIQGFNELVLSHDEMHHSYDEGAL